MGEMTPELLALLTDVEQRAWEMHERHTALRSQAIAALNAGKTRENKRLLRNMKTLEYAAMRADLPRALLALAEARAENARLRTERNDLRYTVDQRYHLRTELETALRVDHDADGDEQVRQAIAAHAATRQALEEARAALGRTMELLRALADHTPGLVIDGTLAEILADPVAQSAAEEWRALRAVAEAAKSLANYWTSFRPDAEQSHDIFECALLNAMREYDAVCAARAEGG